MSSSDILFGNSRLGWIPYKDFSRSQQEREASEEVLLEVDASSLDPPPPEFFIPPPPLPPSLEKDPNCLTREDYQTCDSILTSSTLSDKDYPLLNGHLRSLSIILAVACLFVLAVCITIFIIWRRRRSRTRLDYLWKDSGQNPIRPDHSHHPLIFDDGFESSGGGSSGLTATTNGNSNYRPQRALPRNEFSNDTLHSNIFRIPDSESQIYEEVLDSSGRSVVSSDIMYQRNPPSSTSSGGRQSNPSYYTSGKRPNKADYSTDESSTPGNTTDLPLLSPTYSTPPVYVKSHPLPPLPSATLLRATRQQPPKKSKNIFSTWLNKNSRNSSSSSSSSPSLDYRFLTTANSSSSSSNSSSAAKKHLAARNTPTLRLSDYPTSALQQPLILYSTNPRPHPSTTHIYTTPINGFYGGDFSGLMPNPDDILPKEAWTDFPKDEVDEEEQLSEKKKPEIKQSLRQNKIPSVPFCKPTTNSCDNNSLNSLRNHHMSSLSSSDTTCPDEESDERFNSSSNSSQGSVLR